MKLFFIIPYVPTIIRSRPYNLIRAMKGLGHEVTLATLWTDQEEKAQIERLRESGINIIARHMPLWLSLANCLIAILRQTPMQASYSWHWRLAADIREAIGRNGFHIVHVEHVRGARYALLAKAATTNESPATAVVWDSVDCISHLLDLAWQHNPRRIARWIARWERSVTRICEDEVFTQVDGVLVTSEQDRRDLLAVVTGCHPILAGPEAVDKPMVLANGVDLQYFHPTDDEPDPCTLVFSGKMSYHANVAAVLRLVKRIMPRVWSRRSDVRLLLVGKSPPRSVRELANRPSCRGRVTVTGTVDDVTPFLRRSAIAVVPLVYGVGIQNKVLEAMACATPVIAVSQAVQALHCSLGRDVVVADSDEEFADKIVSLLDDPIRREAIGRAGRAYAEREHDWQRVAERLQGFYWSLNRDSSRGLQHAVRE